MVEVFLELLPGEGVELFDTSDGSVFEVVIRAVFMERGVDLSGTEDDTLNLLRFIDASAVLGVWDDPLEL